MEDFTALQVRTQKRPKKLDLACDILGRATIGLHLSTELFWIEDKAPGDNLSTIRYYCLLHVGPVVIEEGRYKAFEITIPYVTFTVTWFPKKTPFRHRMQKRISAIFSPITNLFRKASQ